MPGEVRPHSDGANTSPDKPLHLSAVNEFLIKSKDTTVFCFLIFYYLRDSRCEGQCWPESCIALRPETLTDTDQSLRATGELISEQMSQSTEGLHKTVENKEYL